MNKFSYISTFCFSYLIKMTCLQEDMNFKSLECIECLECLECIESLQSLQSLQSLDCLDNINVDSKKTRQTRQTKNKTKKQSNKKHNKQSDTTLQDVFGDYMCGVFQDMQEYWSQFGFIDTKQEHCVLDLLDIVKCTISVKPLVLDDDDGYIEDEII